MYIYDMQIYFLLCVCVCVCMHIAIFTGYGLCLRVFDLWQIVCYVCLDSYNYSHYVVQLFYVTSGFTT